MVTNSNPRRLIAVGIINNGELKLSFPRNGLQPLLGIHYIRYRFINVKRDIYRDIYISISIYKKKASSLMLRCVKVKKKSVKNFRRYERKHKRTLTFLF